MASLPASRCGGFVSVPCGGQETHEQGAALDVEARAGFEPANDGFADDSLGPLGYRTDYPARVFEFAPLVFWGQNGDNLGSKTPKFNPDHPQ